MGIYDSHTHLNDEPFFDDVPAFLARAQHYQVTEMNIVGSNQLLNQRALELAHRYHQLHAVIGWHPEEFSDYQVATLDQLANQLADPAVVAVGEIGLDYYWDQDHHELQKQMLLDQISLAQQFHLPIVIHCREALAELYDILKMTDISAIGGVMHSFSGDVDWAKKFLDLGMYLSFSGVVTFNSAHEVQASAQYVPADRLLVETDAPYLTPMPYRGKQNEPAFTAFVVEKLAQIRQVEPDELAQVTTENARQLFKKRD